MQIRQRIFKWFAMQVGPFLSATF